jgi:hypothetical protein
LFRLVTYVPDNVLTPLINLTITIVDNGIYQITGKWPTTIAGIADIVEIARLGAGEPLIRDEKHFGGLTDRSSTAVRSCSPPRSMTNAGCRR